MYYSTITGIGSYLPEKEMTNVELFGEKLGKFADKKVGVKLRRVASETDDIITMSCEAVREAIRNAGILPCEVDMIISVGTPHKLMPANAAYIQQALQIDNCIVIDSCLHCPGFPIGINIAHNFIATGQCLNVVVVGAEVASRAVPQYDFRVAMYFADGAGAVVVSRSKEPGVLANHISSTLGNKECMTINVGAKFGIEWVDTEWLGTIDTKVVWDFATTYFPYVVEQVIKEAGLSLDDIDFIVPHQANINILNVGMETLGLPKEQMITVLEKYGNLISASVPVALHEAYKNGLLKKGDIIVLAAFGASLQYAGTVIEWR